MGLLVGVSACAIEIFIGLTMIDSAEVIQIHSFFPDVFEYDVNQNLIDGLNAFYGDIENWPEEPEHSEVVDTLARNSGPFNEPADVIKAQTDYHSPHFSNLDSFLRDYVSDLRSRLSDLTAADYDVIDKLRSSLTKNMNDLRILGKPLYNIINKINRSTVFLHNHPELRESFGRVCSNAEELLVKVNSLARTGRETMHFIDNLPSRP